MAIKLMQSLCYCMRAPLYNFEMLGLPARGKKSKGGMGKESRDLQNNPVLSSTKKVNGCLEEQLSAFR